MKLDSFGDQDFLRASPQGQLRMGMARVYTCVQEFLANPNDEARQLAIYGTQRLPKLIETFDEAVKTYGDERIDQHFWLRENR